MAFEDMTEVTMVVEFPWTTVMTVVLGASVVVTEGVSVVEAAALVEEALVDEGVT